MNDPRFLRVVRALALVSAATASASCATNPPPPTTSSIGGDTTDASTPTNPDAGAVEPATSASATTGDAATTAEALVSNPAPDASIAAAACPKKQPADGSPCTSAGLFCNYEFSNACAHHSRCTEQPSEKSVWRSGQACMGGPLAPPELAASSAIMA